MDAVLDEPVKPGMVKMVKLANEGALRAGDIVETQRLGKCEVAYIRSTTSIVVKDAPGGYFTLDIDWGDAGRAVMQDHP